jgi:hypothetical protein
MLNSDQGEDHLMKSVLLSLVLGFAVSQSAWAGSPFSMHFDYNGATPYVIVTGATGTSTTTYLKSVTTTSVETVSGSAGPSWTTAMFHIVALDGTTFDLGVNVSSDRLSAALNTVGNLHPIITLQCQNWNWAGSNYVSMVDKAYSTDPTASDGCSISVLRSF